MFVGAFSRVVSPSQGHQRLVPVAEPHWQAIPDEGSHCAFESPTASDVVCELGLGVVILKVIGMCRGQA